MNRFWLQHYPDGVPADVDVSQYSSLVELFEESFARFADRKAAICMDKAITYGELDEMSAAIGAYLQSRELAKEARVAVMMPNVLQNPVALTAGLRAGYTIVNVNPLYTPRELEHQLKDSGAEAIVILENFATTLEKGAAADEYQAHYRRRDRRSAWPQGRRRQFYGAQDQENGPCVFATGCHLVQGCAVSVA